MKTVSSPKIIKKIIIISIYPILKPTLPKGQFSLNASQNKPLFHQHD